MQKLHWSILTTYKMVYVPQVISDFVFTISGVRSEDFKKFSLMSVSSQSWPLNVHSPVITPMLIHATHTITKPKHQFRVTVQSA